MDGKEKHNGSLFVPFGGYTGLIRSGFGCEWMSQEKS